jgi:hypothetical protein
MEDNMHDEMDSAKYAGKVCSICLSYKKSRADLLDHYYGCHFWMIGPYASPNLYFPNDPDEAHFEKGGNKPVWPDCVFWQFGITDNPILPEFKFQRGNKKSQ